MTMLYRTQVTKIGECAADALDDNMMILFDDNAPADAADYCYIHPHAALLGEIKVGGYLILGQSRFPITAVGGVVNQNLGALGHITIRFDGADEVEYPGTVHVRGSCPKVQDLEIGTEIAFEMN